MPGSYGRFSLVNLVYSWTTVISCRVEVSSNWQWFRDPGFVHSVPLNGLTPDTMYYYQYGGPAGWSATFSFHTAPSKSRGVHFIAFGDQDISEAGRNTSRFVSQEAVNSSLDFVCHFGDLGYALGHGWVWDAWGSIVSDGASRVPYMVSVGNHGDVWQTCLCLDRKII